MKKDFDAFYREVKRSPVTFVFKGKEWNVGTSMPALVMLRLMEMKTREESEELDEVETIELMKLVFGEDNFNGLLALGTTMDELSEIFQWTLQALMTNNALKGEDTDPKVKKAR